MILAVAMIRRRNRDWQRIAWSPYACSIPGPGESCLPFTTTMQQYQKIFFRQQLRVRRNTFKRILNLLGHRLGRQPSRFRDPLPPEKILALGLYCLDLGNSYVTIGPSFNVGKATAIKIDKMWWKPSTKFALSTLIFCKLKQTEAATETFVDLSELPNIVGAIVGSLVTIKAPKDSAVDYFSRY